MTKFGTKLINSFELMKIGQIKKNFKFAKSLKLAKLTQYNLNWLNCHKITTTRKINTKSIKMANMTKNIKKKF